MPLKNDLRDLPAAAAPEGEPPSPPTYGVQIAEWLTAQRIAEGDRPMSRSEARIRHSWAGKCAHFIAEEVQHPNEGDTPDVGSLWNFAVGQSCHDIVQNALLAIYGPGCEVEVVVGEGEFAGHIDCTITHDDAIAVLAGEEGHQFWRSDTKVRKVAFEFKSVNGSKFKDHLRTGPDWPTKLQGALNAAAFGADELVLVDMAKENLGYAYAKRLLGDEYHPVERWWAEWHYPAEVFIRWAEVEQMRLTTILDMVDEGRDVPRHIPNEMPAGARIVDPTTGRWEKIVLQDDGGSAVVVDAGKTWVCDYCDQRPNCLAALAALNEKAA